MGPLLAKGVSEALAQRLAEMPSLSIQSPSPSIPDVFFKGAPIILWSKSNDQKAQ